MELFRPEFVDEFRCIADKCTYTCCGGWDVMIDFETYNNYKALYEEIENGCFFDKGVNHYLKLENNICPFLNEKGLCKLVIEHGDDVLSYTCKSYPRVIMGSYDDVMEYSVDNACPAVLDLLRKFQAPLKFNLDNLGEQAEYMGYSDEKQEYLAYRNQMIDLLQMQDMPLWTRLYLIYDFSVQLRNSDKRKMSQNYSDMQWIRYKYRSLDSAGSDFKTKFTLCKLLFQAQIKLKDYGYNKYIVKCLEFCDGLYADNLFSDWDEFEKIWEKESGFIENFCVNSVFIHSLNEEHGNNILILVIEIIQIRFALFLWWLYCGKTLTDEDMLNIICYYARMTHSKNIVNKWLDMNKDCDIMKKGAILIMLKQKP